MKKKRVVVIGAGAVGLITIKCLKEENIEPICFEKSSTYGGLWRYRDEDKEDMASVMKTTITNSSKELGALSDFPSPDEIPNYMHNKDMYQYLVTLAEKYDLLRHITFYKEVVKVELAENYLATGQLVVSIKDRRSQQISTDIYDGVNVCIGHHCYENMPTFPQQEKYKGTIMHTRSLKAVDSFTDKVVIVIGMGNSGLDAAVEISSVYLSTRRGGWILPRLGPWGVPFDLLITSRLTNILTKAIPFNIVCTFFEYFLNMHTFDHAEYKVKPMHRIFSQHLNVSDALPVKLVSGTVKVRSNIKEFVENGVIFEGEDVVTEAEAVVFATGYLIKFPFLSDDITTIKDNKVHLYKYMYPPHLVHHTFATIGLFQSVGASFPISEAQARLFCQVFNGKISLPCKEDKEKDLRAKHEAIAKRYVSSKKHTIQVDYVSFTDEICSMFGAKPNFLKMLFTDPQLFFTLFFGPALPYQYRLQGPYTWKDARKAILTYKTRVYKPLNKDYVSEKKISLNKLSILLFFLGLVFFFINTFY